jgi:hypothetical protein
MAAVSVEVRRERGIASLHVFCSHRASCTTHHRSCQPSSPAGFRSSEEEPACGNRTAGEDSIWRQGSAAGPPTASLRPGRQASALRETKRSSALKHWALQKPAVPPQRTAGKDPTVRRRGFPRRGRGRGCETRTSTAGKNCPGQNTTGRGCAAFRQAVPASSRRSANRQSQQTGRQAPRPASNWSEICGRDRPPMTARCRVVFRSTMRTGSRAGMQPVQQACGRTCKPPSGRTSRQPQPKQPGCRGARQSHFS